MLVGRTSLVVKLTGKTIFIVYGFMLPTTTQEARDSKTLFYYLQTDFLFNTPKLMSL